MTEENKQLSIQQSTNNKKTSNYQIVKSSIENYNKKLINKVELLEEIRPTIRYWMSDINELQKVGNANIITLIIKLIFMLNYDNKIESLDNELLITLLDIILLHMESAYARKEKNEKQTWNILGDELKKSFVLEYMNVPMISKDKQCSGDNILLNNINDWHLLGQIIARFYSIFALEYPTNVSIHKLISYNQKYCSERNKYRDRVLNSAKVLFKNINNWHNVQKSIWNSWCVKHIRDVKSTVDVSTSTPVLTLLPQCFIDKTNSVVCISEEKINSLIKDKKKNKQNKISDRANNLILNTSNNMTNNNSINELNNKNTSTISTNNISIYK